MAWNATHPGRTTGSSSDLGQPSSFLSTKDFEQYVRNKFGYKDGDLCEYFAQDDESRPLQNKRKSKFADFRRRSKPKTGESEKDIASSAASSIGQTSVGSTFTNHAKPEVREEERSWPASAAASSIGQASVGSTSTNHAKPEVREEERSWPASAAASSIGQTSVSSTSTNHAKPEAREEERSWPASAAAFSIGQTSVGSTSTNHAKPEGKDKSTECSRHFTYYPPERFPPEGVHPTDYQKGCDSCKKRYTARYCARCVGFVASDDFKSSKHTHVKRRKRTRL